MVLSNNTDGVSQLFDATLADQAVSLAGRVFQDVACQQILIMGLHGRMEVLMAHWS